MERFIDDFYSLVVQLKLSLIDEKSANLIEGELMQIIEDIQQDVKLARLLKRKFEEVRTKLSQTKTFRNQ